MPKFVVTIDRNAIIGVDYHIYAPTAEGAEALVQKAIDDGKLSCLGVPVHKRCVYIEDSGWEVMDVGVVP